MNKPIIRLILLVVLLIAICLPSSAKFAKYRIISIGRVLATAYNSMEGQTDSTPWITASGTRCREGVIAANHLPIGTKVMIEGYGDRVFTVEDRMNARYNKRIDIWMRNYQDAKRFGVRNIKYYIVEKA